MVPPAEYANRREPLRSLLQLEDGSMVRSAADWALRKKELRAVWMEALGAWPEVLAHPKLEVLRETDLPGYKRKRVRVEIAAGRFEEGWLLVPEGKGPHPAVLVPFYDPETSVGLGDKEHRDYARRLAERGFVALAVGSPGGNARLPDPGREGWQPLSFLAYVSANCANVLRSLPEVDAKRLGIVGHSYGGKWALFSACLNEAFACAAWSDPGIGFDDTRPSINYWEPWYLGRTAGPPRAPGLPTAQNPATGPYLQLRQEGHDLHEVQALMAPRPFFVSGGSEDPPSRSTWSGTCTRCSGRRTEWACTTGRHTRRRMRLRSGSATFSRTSSASRLLRRAEGVRPLADSDDLSIITGVFRLRGADYLYHI
jgi:hypothetical protein